MSENLFLIPRLLCDERLWAHQTKHLADIAECMVADITGAESGADRHLCAAGYAGAA